MPRRALIVGIDNYANFVHLSSCVADATAMEQRLSRNVDGSANYSCVTILADASAMVNRADLRGQLATLFNYSGEVLFYFSGHGHADLTGGWIATSDGTANEVGISMDEILSFANNANPRPRDILIILDCCDAGNMGSPGTLGSQITSLRENITVLAASLPRQPALAGPDFSAFTTALIGGLDGGAADHLGFVTASSLYTYAERRFGAWDQRPIFKSNITDVNIVRQCAPLLELHSLRKLPDFFPDPHVQFQLDPGHEPQDADGNLPSAYDKNKFEQSRLLKVYRDVGLVRATNLGEDFYFAARRSHTVELTLRGQEYWYLVSVLKV